MGVGVKYMYAPKATVVQGKGFSTGRGCTASGKIHKHGFFPSSHSSGYNSRVLTSFQTSKSEEENRVHGKNDGQVNMRENYFMGHGLNRKISVI